MGNQTLRCSRCILSSHYPTIRLDEAGICSFCHSWDAQWGKSGCSTTIALPEDLLNKLRQESAEYDCVVGLSGGKDSCYAASLGKQGGLRQVAVTFDNGFLTDVAKENIRTVVNTLSLAHLTVGFGWQKMKRLYRHSLLQAGEFCSVCNVGIRAAIYRAARLFQVSSVIAGTSPRTEAYSPADFFCCSDGYFRNVFRPLLSRQEMKDYVYVGEIWRGIYHLSGLVKWVQLPRYLPWKENEIIELLRRQFGWSGDLWEQHQDCSMSDAKEFLNWKRFGVIEKEAKLSALVRDEQLTRESALLKLEEHLTSLAEGEREIRGKIADTFELSVDEMKEIEGRKHIRFVPRSASLHRQLKQLLHR